MGDRDLRSAIQQRLEQGLSTEVFPRAESSRQMQAILRLLRASDGKLDSKLILAGLKPSPVVRDGIVQACETCMYYLVRRKLCDLPELELPVEPLWSCRLWRM